MKKIVAFFLMSTVALLALAQNASAMPQFKKAFTDKYPAKHKSEEFKAVAKKASCNVCHISGAKKTVNNHYGKALAKLIEGNANDRKKKAKEAGGSATEKEELAKILAELDKAFKKVEELKSPTGEKFGELLKEGKLPVDPAWAKEEYKKQKEKEEAEKSGS